MIVQIKPSVLCGQAGAPPSKSMAHRYLIGAALSKDISCLSGIDYSEDILASIDCLRSLGAEITIDGDTVSVNPKNFMKAQNPVLECRESGSTLRFFIPLCLCLNKEAILKGSTRLFERPLDVYKDLCQNNGFTFKKDKNSVLVGGNLKSGTYKIRGDISSQFITGLIFALVYLGNDSFIEIIPPFESRSDINLTISALKSFGAEVEFVSEYKIAIKKSCMHAYSGKIEGDYSNAAFLDAFNHTGSQIEIKNLNPQSLQGDKVYADYFDKSEEICSFTDIKKITVDTELDREYNYRVVFSDIDENLHMNNTRYSDICLDAIGGTQEFIEEVSVDFLSEARLGDELVIKYTLKGDRYFFVAENKNTEKRCFTAEIKIR